jgi:hypothetical protein
MTVVIKILLFFANLMIRKSILIKMVVKGIMKRYPIIKVDASNPTGNQTAILD